MKRLSRLLILFLVISCTDDSEIVAPGEVNVWENLRTTDGLLSNQVLSLLESSDSSLWVGTDEGITLYEKGSFTSFPSINPQIGAINDIAEDEDGNIYIGSNDGLGIYNGSSWDFFNIFGEFELGVLALHVDNNGNLWLGTTLLGILVFEDINQNPTQFFDSSCSECNDVNVFLAGPTGDLWIGTDGNLKKFDGSSFEEFTRQDGLPDNDVTSLEFDKWGRLWVGTF